ncbi:MAG: LamG domain-containing protein [Sedimentisphaerales bacterium]|nr:LamG domain-containing protein [Sedimentisphaerales bacterium]
MFGKSVYLTSFIFLLSVVLTREIEAKLVGWWKFDEGSGVIAVDSSGGGNDGTLEGNADWDAGNFGYAVSLDGSSWVELPPAPWDSIERNVTVAFWAFGDDTMPVNNFVFAAYSADENPARQASAHTPWGNGQIYWDTGYDGSAYDRINTALPSEYHKGQWVHFAFTKDVDAGEVKIFINGELFHSGTGMTRIMTGVNAFTIGVRATNDRTIGYVGRIDDFRLYNHTLIEAEIMAVMEGAGASFPRAMGPNPADGALINATWVTLEWHAGDSAVSHDVYLGNDYDVVSNATRDSDVFWGNQTSTFYVAGFPGYAFPNGLVPGTTYYWRIDEVNDANPDSPWKGSVWSFSVPPKTAYAPDPADGAEFVGPTNVTLSWTPGYGAILHTVYLGNNFDDVSNAAGGLPLGTTTYSPGSLELEKVYYWRVDEFDAVETHKGDVWSFTTPGAVGNPQPAYGATDVSLNTMLSWTPSDSAASHQLYIGTDKETVRNADTGAPEYKGSTALGAENYDPGLLGADTIYYWHVDEVDGQGNTLTGPLWTFATGSFVLVEDFEGYTDDDTAGQAIWQTWIDGYGVADNGAQVGYLLPPYAEQTIIYGGLQSMPLMYTNDAGVSNSEASMTLSAPRDWTQASVTELSLWFRGGSTNAAEPLYVAISNSAGSPAVVAHEDSSAATARSWTQWRIPLQAFSDQGINLTNVDKIAVGLGDKSGVASFGGSGTIYIDDIRLDR